MRPEMHHLSIRAVRADALFVSALQRSDTPTAGQVRRAVATAVRSFGSRGCVERVAQEFGDHPDTAVARMRWARAVTGEVFARPAHYPAAAPPLSQPHPAAAPPLSQPHPAAAPPLSQPHPAAAPPLSQPHPAAASPLSRPQPAAAPLLAQS